MDRHLRLKHDAAGYDDSVDALTGAFTKSARDASLGLLQVIHADQIRRARQGRV